MKTAAPRDTRRGATWQDVMAAWWLVRSWALPALGVRALRFEARGEEPIDDILVAYADRVEHLQLKHTIQDGATLIWSDLAGKAGPGPLLQRLFVKWQAHTQEHPGQRIHLHVVTNVPLSTQPANDAPSADDFDRLLLRPLRHNPSATLTPLGDNLLSTVRSIVASEDDLRLRAFLSAIRLETAQPGVESLRAEIARILREVVRRPSHRSDTEASALIALAQDLSTGARGDRWLDRADVNRLVREELSLPATRAEHRLSLPQHYEPRPHVGEAIVQQARRLGTGYLRVEGPPGCGKTTLATWLADTYPDDVLLRYHAFHPLRRSGADRRARATGRALVLELLAALADRQPSTVGPVLPEEAEVARAAEELWAGGHSALWGR